MRSQLSRNESATGQNGIPLVCSPTGERFERTENGWKTLRIQIIGTLLLGLASLHCVRYAPPIGTPTDPRVAQAALELATGGPTTMVALLEMDVDTPLGDRAIRANAIFRAPGELRLEFLTPTDQMAALVLRTGGRTVVYERGGEACRVQEDCEGIPLPGLSLIHI